MADALASGASGSNTVWVQVPSPARKALIFQGFFLFRFGGEYARRITKDV